MLSDHGVPTENRDIEHLEFWVFGDYDMGIDKDVEDPRMAADNDRKGWNPYEQDLTHYPEIFKVYGENFNRYENAKQHFENEKLGQQPVEGPLKFWMPTNMDPWTKKYDDFIPWYTGTNMQ